MSTKKPVYVCLATAVALAVLFSCQSRYENPKKNEVNSLVEKSVVNKVKIDFKLRFAEDNKIPHQSFELTIETSKKDDHTIDLAKTKQLQIFFGKLTNNHYSLLMKRYGGQNLVPFDKDREYELTDFLPPKIQAFNNKFLIGTWAPEPGLPAALMDPRDAADGIEVPLTTTDMNCWAMAYEVLKDYKLPFDKQKAQIGMFMNNSAAMTFVVNKNNKSFTQIKSLPKNKLEGSSLTPAERNKNLQFMDVLVLSFDTIIGPAHVALWIDEDLYFEKTNSGGDDPIRLSTYEKVVEPFLPNDSEDADVGRMVSFKRMTQESMPGLESFADQHPFDSDLIKLIPPTLAKKFIYEENGGAAGGLGRLLISKINNFKMIQDPTTKRATLPDAEKLSSFYSGDTLCRIGVKNGSSDGFGKFIYKLDKNFVLTIFSNNNGLDGREIAKIPGRFVNGKETKNGEFDWFTFAAGDKVIRMYSKKPNTSESSEYFLDHPGVKADISFGVEGSLQSSGCIRPPKDLHKI